MGTDDTETEKPARQ